MLRILALGMFLSFSFLFLFSSTLPEGGTGRVLVGKYPRAVTGAAKGPAAQLGDHRGWVCDGGRLQRTEG